MNEYWKSYFLSYCLVQKHEPKTTLKNINLVTYVQKLYFSCKLYM